MLKLSVRVFLALVLLATPSAFGAENIGYYIGSFDPPTLGHKAVVVAALANPELSLKKIYITVNHSTDKDFNASMFERIEMLRKLFAELGDRVEILSEPLEGRPAFARYLMERHHSGNPNDPTKIIGIFGDDTYEKNFRIFTSEAELANFDYTRVARPMTESATTESYTPIIHDMTIEADGTSSSKARDLIGQGKDPAEAQVLAPDVWDFIRALKLYFPIATGEAARRAQEFSGRFRDFKALMRERFPAWPWDGIQEPSFKVTQSAEAQNDKFIRHVVRTLGIGLDQQLRFRPEAETLLGVKHRTRPLRSTEQAGIFLGSFDNPSLDQKNAMRSAIAQGGLDVLYLVALESSRKEIKRPLAERLALLHELTRDLGTRVLIQSTPSLETSPQALRAIANEFIHPSIAVFGENVFDANYVRLKEIPNLRFAVAPFAGTPPREYPQGTLILNCEGALVPMVDVPS